MVVDIPIKLNISTLVILTISTKGYERMYIRTITVFFFLIGIVIYLYDTGFSCKLPFNLILPKVNLI